MSQLGNRKRKCAAMENPIQSSDPDLRGSWPALLRARERAWKFAKLTRTPFYVMRNGKVVNLNPQRKRRRNTKKQGK
jgi:hypothetical protein